MCLKTPYLNGWLDAGQVTRRMLADELQIVYVGCLAGLKQMLCDRFPQSAQILQRCPRQLGEGRRELRGDSRDDPPELDLSKGTEKPGRLRGPGKRDLGKRLGGLGAQRALGEASTHQSACGGL